MRRIDAKARFKSDLRVYMVSVQWTAAQGQELKDLIELLEARDRLPAGYREHLLVDDYAGLWECHLDADWLVVYRRTDDIVTLLRTGTHRHLFRKVNRR